MGIGSIAMNTWKYGRKFLKITPDLILGNGAEVAGKSLRTAKGSIFDIAKQTGKAVEALSVKNGVKIPFWKRITSKVGRIKTLTKAGVRAGAKKGLFGKIIGGSKGFFKGLGKNMPMIVALPTVLFELPNVFKAVSEEGIGQGISEIFKTGARLTGGAVGAAIGSAICPGLGSFAGWMLGEWLTSKVVGKSYSEQQAELNPETTSDEGNVPPDGSQELPNRIPPQVTPSLTDPNYNPNTTNIDSMPNPFFNNMGNDPYANDIFYQQLFPNSNYQYQQNPSFNQVL